MNQKQKTLFNDAMAAAAIAAAAIPAGRMGPAGWEDYAGVDTMRDMKYAVAFNSLPRDARDAAAASRQVVPGCIVYAEHDDDCPNPDGAWAFRGSVGCPHCM